MSTTLVGIFDDYKDAQSAVAELTDAGIKQGDISIARNEPAGKGYTTYGGAGSKDYQTGTSIGDKISNFFENLFGGDDNEEEEEDSSVKNERDLYAEAVRRGSTVVTVKVEDAMTDEAADILNDHGAADVDRRGAQYRASGYQGHDPQSSPYSAEQTQAELKSFADQKQVALPVIEEQINFGKRVVQRGGVRVHTVVTERPVEEQVTLREENVTVNRRPVNRAASAADLKNFKEGEFNVTTQAEEAVVGKESRVVEEVVVGKNVTEHQETVHDTVRRTDVEVEQIDGETAEQKRKTTS